MLPSGISVRVREDLIDGVSRTQTTIIVDPLVTLSGHRITMADIGTIGYGKIDQGKASEEIISWTGITDNVTTYTLTGCTWGVNFHNLENSTANIKRHVSGAQFAIMTDMHYIAGEFRDNADNVFTNTDPMEFQGNEILLGDGTSDNDKVIKADNGDANEPFMAYDEGLGKWVISNDGVNSYDPEQGGSGVTAGDGISIVGGEVSVKTSEASGVHVTGDEVAIEYQTNPGLDIVDNKLGVKVKSGTGLLKDADGIYNDSIDPDNPVAQSPAKLIGGDDVVLQNFIDLGSGNNDGAVKATIDGIQYNDIPVTLVMPSGSEEAKITVSGTGSNKYAGQSFTGFGLITKIAVRIPSGTPNLSPCIIREGEDVNGTILGTSSNGVLVGDYINYEFSTPVFCKLNSIFSFFFPVQYVYINTGNPYNGGRAWGGFAWVNTVDLAFIITGYTAAVVATEDEVATALQTAIRAATGNTETVIYDTDHFEISSSISGKNLGSQVLKLQPPTIGTDISGAGYLDLGANATEVAGDGDDYRLVRLDEDGKLPIEILSRIRAIASNTLRASADTERSRGGTDLPINTPTKYKEISTEFGGIIRVKFDGRGNGYTGQEYAQVYKNGVPVGTLRDVSSSTYTTFSEDLLFEKGDLIQLYIWTTSSNPSYKSYGKNFRVYYDLENGDIANVNLN